MIVHSLAGYIEWNGRDGFGPQALSFKRDSGSSCALLVYFEKRGGPVFTCAFRRLGGGQDNSAQAEQFQEWWHLLVELTQLSLCPRQIYTAETHQDYLIWGHIQ